MRTTGTRRLIRSATPLPSRDLWPRLRARLDARARLADERVPLELPAFTWTWRFVAAASVALPLVVPEPARFLAAAGLL